MRKSWGRRKVRHCGLVESARTCDRTGSKFEFWQCRINIISHVHTAYNYPGPFGAFGVHYISIQNLFSKAILKRFIKSLERKIEKDASG